MKKTLIVVALLLLGCASTGIGKAIQVGVVNKAVVEGAAVELAKLCIVEAVKKPDCDKGDSLYLQYADAQRTAATSLAAWKTISSVENSKRLEATLGQAKVLAEVYLSFAGKYVDLNSVKKEVK